MEQEIAKAKIFHLVPIAALTLFQVRRRKNILCYESEIIVGKSLSKDVTWLNYVKRKFEYLLLLFFKDIFKFICTVVF